MSKFVMSPWILKYWYKLYAYNLFITLLKRGKKKKTKTVFVDLYEKIGKKELESIYKRCIKTGPGGDEKWEIEVLLAVWV